MVDVPCGARGARDSIQDLCVCFFVVRRKLILTPSKFNIAPEKWLEDYFPIEKVTFQGLC